MFKNEGYTDMHSVYSLYSELAGLLSWNIGNDICFIELHITKYLEIYREL
jgi:hypothetical protein